MKNGIIKSFIVLLFFCSFSGWPQDTKHPPISFVYPQLDSPIKVVFETIINGFETTTKDLETQYLQVKDQAQASPLIDRLKAADPSPIVVLGQHAFSLVNIPALQNRLIVGALRESPDTTTHSLLSLSVDANVIKNKLRLVMPHIKTVYFGDEGQKTLWFSPDNALPHFKTTPIKKDQASMVKYLWETILAAEPDSDAVWINSRVEPYMLYKLSEKAWEKGIILISNNPAHLDQGATLVFYTDNVGMGERLGVMAREKQLHPHLYRAEALQAIHMGINIRFAKHANLLIPTDLNMIFQVIK